MKNQFKYKLNKTAMILSIITIAIVIAYLVLTIVESVSQEFTNWLRIVLSIIFSAIILYIDISLYKSHYIISDDGVHIKISITNFLLELNSISSIKYDKEFDKLLLYYISSNKIKYIIIQIDNSEYKKFIDTLRHINTNILYED